MTICFSCLQFPGESNREIEGLKAEISALVAENRELRAAYELLQREHEAMRARLNDRLEDDE